MASNEGAEDEQRRAIGAGHNRAHRLDDCAWLYISLLVELTVAEYVSSGVGKTETANRLGEALFTTTRNIDEYGTNEIPCGLLMLRGEHFSNTSEVGRGGPIDVQNFLKAVIVEHLVQTEGHALIVLDEVQKVMPGVLDVSFLHFLCYSCFYPVDVCTHLLQNRF